MFSFHASLEKFGKSNNPRLFWSCVSHKTETKVGVFKFLQFEIRFRNGLEETAGA